MLGAIAFLSAAAIIWLFVVTMRPFFRNGFANPLAIAYLLFMTVMFVFGLTTISENVRLLGWSVIIANGLLAAGATIMTLGPRLRSRSQYVITSVGVGLTVAVTRYLVSFPEPRIEDGILYFDTPLLIGILIALMMITIWLPGTLKLAPIIAKATKIEEAKLIYSGLLTFVTMSGVAFFAARNRTAVILTFTLMCVGFLGLALLNYLAVKLKDSKQ